MITLDIGWSGAFLTEDEIAASFPPNSEFYPLELTITNLTNQELFLTELSRKKQSSMYLANPYQDVAGSVGTFSVKDFQTLVRFISSCQQLADLRKRTALIRIAGDPVASSGGTIDPTARASAAASKAKIDAIYKVAGETIKANSEALVVLDDGSIVSFINASASPIVIPATPTKVNLVAAGLTIGGGGSDPALTNKVNNIYKIAGESVPSGSEVFVLMADNTVLNYVNKTGAAITVPVSPTKASLLAAGLSPLTTSGTDARVNSIYKAAGDTVTVDSEVFIVLDSGATVNYRNPGPGTLTVPAVVTNANILAAGFAPIAARESHLHSILANSATLAGSDTIFKVASGKLWKNKKANPDIALVPADAAWATNFEEAIPAASKEIGSGAVIPTDNTTYSFFNLIGHATLPNGIFYWDTSATAWVQV